MIGPQRGHFCQNGGCGRRMGPRVDPVCDGSFIGAATRVAGAMEGACKQICGEGGVIVEQVLLAND